MNVPAAVTAASLALAMAASPLLAQSPSESLLGSSEEGRPIHALEWNAGQSPTVLVFGGIHGDERSAGAVALRTERRWRADAAALVGVHVILITIANPDGWERNARKNTNGVDLNRNFPDEWAPSERGSASHGGSEPLSESEARILHDLVERVRPDAIVSIHSCRSCGGENNYDGPATALAEAMSVENGYEPTDTWGAPTPGSFGTYAGKAKRIPTITLEIPREVNGEAELDANVRAIEAFVRRTREGR